MTFAGKEPHAIGYLYFVPREMSTDKLKDSTGPLPASGQFGADGGFRGTTFADGDGVRPGTYEVRIECEAPRAANLTAEQSHNAPAQSRVPKSAKPPDLVVPRSGPRPVRYDLDL